MAYFSFTLSVIFFFLTGSLEAFQDHLLPSNHPIKLTLDTIFSASRVTSTKETLEQAGFKIITKGHYSDTVIARHPKVPGYFFKLYTDDQTGVNDVEKLMARIQGALLAKEMIARHGWGAYFKVPQKWLYRLPEDPQHQGKQVILIASDMDIYSKQSNLEKWSKKIKKERLQILYKFLTEGGFADSIYPSNLPFSRDGKWACIDTEKYYAWPIPYHILTKYLCYPMQVYWQTLIENKGLNGHLFPEKKSLKPLLLESVALP